MRGGGDYNGERRSCLGTSPISPDMAAREHNTAILATTPIQHLNHTSLQLPTTTYDQVFEGKKRTSVQSLSFFLLRFCSSSTATAAVLDMLPAAQQSCYPLVAELMRDKAFLNSLLSPSPHMGMCKQGRTLPSLDCMCEWQRTCKDPQWRNWSLQQ